MGPVSENSAVMTVAVRSAGACLNVCTSIIEKLSLLGRDERLFAGTIRDSAHYAGESEVVVLVPFISCEFFRPIFMFKYPATLRRRLDIMRTTPISVFFLNSKKLAFSSALREAVVVC